MHARGAARRKKSLQGSLSPERQLLWIAQDLVSCWAGGDQSGVLEASAQGGSVGLEGRGKARQLAVVAGEEAANESGLKGISKVAVDGLRIVSETRIDPAVEGLHEVETAAPQTISEEDEGLVLHLDIAKLDADARRKVEAVLEKALGAVRMQEHGRGDKA